MARYQTGLRTEARILDATRDLLSEAGLEGTTLRLICERAGVRPGSFYNLFDSKEEAVLKVVGHAIAAVDPDPAGTHTDHVEDLVDAYVAFVTGSPELAKVYLQVAVAGALSHGAVRSRLIRHHDERVRRFAAALTRAGRGGEDPDAAAELLLATLNGLAFRWVLDPAFDFAATAGAQRPADLPDPAGLTIHFLGTSPTPACVPAARTAKENRMKRSIAGALGLALVVAVGWGLTSNDPDSNEPGTGGLTPLAPETASEQDTGEPVLFIDDEPVTPFDEGAGELEVDGSGMIVPGFEGDAEDMIVVNDGSGMVVPGWEGEVEDTVVEVGSGMAVPGFEGTPTEMIVLID